MQQHDKVQQKPWSFTESGLSSKCPDTVLPLDPAKSGREKAVDSARLSRTIIQFKAHAILISNTQSQQAHICKSYKKPCDPCKPHFYIVKLGLLGYTLYFISAQNVLSRNLKNIRIFLSEKFHFLVVKNSVYLNRHVFVKRSSR